MGELLHRLPVEPTDEVSRWLVANVGEGMLVPIRLVHHQRDCLQIFGRSCLPCS